MDKTLFLKDVLEGVDVYGVDGGWLRENVDRDWTNFGQPPRYPYVPENEMWISYGEQDYNFYIENMIGERLALASGQDQEAAKQAGLRAEIRLRASLTGDRPDRQADIALLVHKEVFSLQDGIITWVVNGDQVRQLADPNFTQGGNPEFYPFVPKQPYEIWIDDKAPQDEWKYDDLHERTESEAMRERGWGYEDAHRLANQVEFRQRRLDHSAMSVMSAAGQ